MSTSERDPFLIDGPHNALRNFVQLSVSPVENTPSETFTLRGFVSCDTHTRVANSGKEYRLSIRMLKIEATKEGCQPVPTSMIEDVQQAGTLSEKNKQSSQTSLSGQIGGKTNAKASEKGGAAEAGLSAAAELKAISKSDASLETKYLRARVRVVAGGWRIGERDGDDPLSHGGYLDGRYMEKTNWATYRFDPGKREARVTYRVILPLSMLEIEPARSAPLGRIFGGEKADAASIRNQLKAAVASMVVRDQLADLTEGKGFDAGTHELVLAQAMITARRLDGPESVGMLLAPEEQKALPRPAETLMLPAPHKPARDSLRSRRQSAKTRRKSAEQVTDDE